MYLQYILLYINLYTDTFVRVRMYTYIQNMNVHIKLPPKTTGVCATIPSCPWQLDSGMYIYIYIHKQKL